jgi:hypothetical protein
MLDLMKLYKQRTGLNAIMPSLINKELYVTSAFIEWVRRYLEFLSHSDLEIYTVIIKSN